MIDVLCVYKDVEMINQSPENASIRESTTVSYDEKPGIQAIKNIAVQLRPVPGEHPAVGRDYEYKRLGIVSLLGGIDLHTGSVHALVKDRHRSREFIEFLDMIDGRYPKDWVIRIVLDNHSSHVSKETRLLMIPTGGQRAVVDWDRSILSGSSTFFRVVPTWPFCPPFFLPVLGFGFFSRFGSLDGGLLLLVLFKLSRLASKLTMRINSDRLIWNIAN